MVSECVTDRLFGKCYALKNFRRGSPLKDYRLNFAFAIASASTNISSLPVGTLLDRYGPRFTSLIGCFSIALGSLFLASSKSVRIIDLNILASIFLGVGGSCIFIPSFHLSNAFPRYSGLILALVTGAFNASAAVFLLYRTLYEPSKRAPSLQLFFSGYLIVPAAIFLAQVLLMPITSYKTVAQLDEKQEHAKDVAWDIHLSDDELDTDAEVYQVRNERASERRASIAAIDELIGTKAERETRYEHIDETRVRSGVWGALHGYSATEQMQTPWFWLFTLFTILQMLRFNFFIATVRSQYTYLLGHDKGEAIGDFFDIALPLGGITAVGAIGVILDTTSTELVLALLVCWTTLIGIMSVVPLLWAGYVTVCLDALFRPLYYSAMS